MLTLEDNFTEYYDILTTEDLTEILHISKNTAYKLLNSGEIKCFRIGKSYRIPKDSLIDYINSLYS